MDPSHSSTRALRHAYRHAASARTAGSGASVPSLAGDALQQHKASGYEDLRTSRHRSAIGWRGKALSRQHDRSH